MGTMMIEVSDGRPVHVIVGEASFAIAPEPARITGERTVAPRRRRPLLTLAGGVAVLAIGFVVGQHTITSQGQAEAQTASAVNAPPPVEQAFPGRALPLVKPTAAPASSSGQVPPALTQQLAQRPQVVPPPGAPQAAAKPAKSPFGLGD